MEKFDIEKEKKEIEKLNWEADRHILEGKELNRKAKIASERATIIFGL